MSTPEVEFEESSEKVFSRTELAQLFDLTFVYSAEWRILVDSHTTKGSGWVTMNTWIDTHGNYIMTGKSTDALGKYIAHAIRCGLRVRVLAGERL